MTKARQRRKEQIVATFDDLCRNGSSQIEASEEIARSEQNKLWCLRPETIRLIATYKNYGKPSNSASRAVKI